MIDYVCYCATKIITTQLCKQVYNYMSWPVVLAHHSRTTVLEGKTIVQTLRKTTVQTLVQAGLDIMPVPYRKDCKICKHRNHFRSTKCKVCKSPLSHSPGRPTDTTASEGYKVGRKGLPVKVIMWAERVVGPLALLPVNVLCLLLYA